MAKSKDKSAVEKKLKVKNAGVHKAKAVKKAKGKAGGGQRFWAVKVGRNPGIYTDHDRFQQQIDGYSGAISKRFATRQEAEAWLASGNAQQAPTILPAAPSASIKFDHTVLPRSFILGATGDFRSPASLVKDEPVFGLLAQPKQPVELPHHRQLRIEQAEAAERRLQELATTEEAKLGDQGAADGEPAGEQSAQKRARAALTLPEDSDDNDDAAAAADTDRESSLDARSDDGGGEGTVESDAGPSEDSESTGELDEDFIALGPAPDSAQAAPDAPPDDGAAAASSADKDGRSGGEAAAAVKTTWEDWEHPWYEANQRINSQSLRLHNEIVGLCQLLKATHEEDNQRHEAIAKVEQVVQSVFPGSELNVFGSFSTGLHLPTSDVDCVILKAKVAHVPTALKALGVKLQSMDWVEGLQVISTAKVPIVKLDVMPVGLKFDISMGVENGSQAVELVTRYLAAWPSMRPLVTILKLFLLQRAMNEVFSGGLGSYALLISVVAFLQTHHSRTRPLRDGRREAGRLEANLGELMIDYCRLYGRALSFQEVGVTCANGGEFYVKKERFRGAWQEHPERISLMDPLDPSNDVSRGSYNFSKVRVALDHAYGMLTMPAPRNVSLLSRILRLDEILMIRPPPPKQRPPPPRTSDHGGQKRSSYKSGKRRR